MKRRVPSLRKIHFESFPAIHIKKMDWMDFLLKFSSELLIIAITLTVGGLNFLFFTGSSARGFQDQSLAANFIDKHHALNPKLYAMNNSIITVVSKNSFLPQAQADFNGLDSQGLTETVNTGDTMVMGDDNGLLAPSPDSIKGAIVNVTKKIYVTKDGDTLKSVAAANNISTNTIRWSNPNLASDQIKQGWELIIPPVNGIAVTADDNTTLPDLAAKYNPQRYSSDKNVREQAASALLDKIITYNGLGSAEDINPGDFIIIPDGAITQAPTPPAPKPTPAPTKPSKKTSKIDSSLNAITSVSDGYDDNNHLFPKGYCTWYVATRVKITFGGNAKNWLANAKASGYVVNKEPAPRTVVVTTDSKRYGHVAYVEEVTDTAILVSEMNFEHFDKIDQRWIPLSSPTIRGYIYQ
jgi:surface antigen